MRANGEESGEPLCLVSGDEGLSVRPLGLKLPAITFPADSREAAILLQRWENENGLVDCFTHGDESFWWGCQRHWFSVSLALLLEALRILKPVFAGLGSQRPGLVVITGYSTQAEAIAGAVAALSPGTRIIVKKNSKLGIPGHLRWYGLIGVNRARAALGRIRLERATATRRSGRVVIFQSEMQWEHGRDREMGSVSDALRARGLDVITVAAPCDRLWKNLIGLLTRPRDHIFSDFVGRSGLPFVPTKTPDWTKQRFEHEGYDFTEFVRGWMDSWAPKDSVRDTDGEWTRLIGRLSPDVVLMAHEHYHRAVIGRAASAAKVRFGAVQHGLLSESSPLYILPRRAAGKISLPWRTFVYTNRDAETLSRLSLHDRASIVVSGSTEWDRLRQGGGPPKAPAGGKWPHGRLRLLFTSQHGLDEGIIDGLLDGLEGMRDKARLRVRPHPWEMAAGRWARAFRNHPGVKAEIGKGGPLEKDLFWCDLHVTFSSTCITHAIIAGIPSILFGANEYPWREQFVTAGLAIKVDNGRAFADAVAYWSTVAARERFALDRERFLVTSGVGNVPAGERIAEEVLASLQPAASLSTT